MNSGSSAPTTAGAHSAGAAATSSWYQRSRPASQATAPPVRRTTTTRFTPGILPLAMALSTLALSGTFLPPRRPSSAVMTRLDWQSSMRPISDSGEKPPNTTECTAPMRAQASIATAASGIIGR